MTLLECVRVFGPIQFCEVAQRLGITQNEACALLREHIGMRLVGEPQPGWYDVTPLGREEFGKLHPAVEVVPSLDEEDCVGIEAVLEGLR